MSHPINTLQTQCQVSVVEATTDGSQGHLTCKSILGFKKSTKTPFHTSQAALTLLVSLSLQVGDCHFELLKTEMK